MPPVHGGAADVGCPAPMTRYAAWWLTGIAIAPVLGRAQSPTSGATQTPAVVTSVQIKRENVFDVAELTSWYTKAMNAIHIVTRERVIARELLVREGQPYDSAMAAESARNLRNLGIFREVHVDSVRTDSGLMAQVTTHDSWTTQPYASFKTVGTEVTWGLGLTEKNLLGLQITASLKYTSDPDRNTTDLAAKLPRLFKDRLGIGGQWELMSDGDRARLVFDAPFQSLSGKQQFRTEFRYADESTLRFFNGEEEASDTLRHEMGKMTLTFGRAPFASPIGYLRIGTTFQARREDYTQLGVNPQNESRFAEIELNVETSRPEYAVIRGYGNLVSPEDVDLSTTLRAGLWLAPAGLGYESDGFGGVINAQTGVTTSDGFITGVLRASGLFNRGGLDSGSVIADVVIAMLKSEKHSVIFGLNAGMQKNPFPGEEFDLGSTFGPRAFPLHSFTGDRMFYASGEYRTVVKPDIAGLIALGVAAFADYGGAWYTDTPVRTGADVGVGLRIGSMRASSGGKITRLDIARRFKNDVLPASWVFVIGSGFTFDRP